MTTKIKLYNKALGFIGGQRLHPTTGLTETTATRYELDAVYDDALQYMLEQAAWKFALRTVLIEADTGIDPGFGLAYGYTIPTDYVRLAGISNDDYFTPGNEPNYAEENGYFFASVDQFYLKYVSNDASYGLDLALYPQHYTEALAAWMAYKSVLPITGDRPDRNDILAQHNRALSISKRLHALSDPVKLKPPGTWGPSRGGHRRTGFRNGRMSF